MALVDRGIRRARRNRLRRRSLRHQVLVKAIHVPHRAAERSKFSHYRLFSMPGRSRSPHGSGTVLLARSRLHEGQARSHDAWHGGKAVLRRYPEVLFGEVTWTYCRQIVEVAVVGLLREVGQRLGMFPLGGCACAKLGYDILITIDDELLLMRRWQRLATRESPRTAAGPIHRRAGHHCVGR